MMEYPNGGFCFVDMTGVDLTGGTPRDFKISGIHAMLKSAILNGKIVVASGITDGSGTVLLTPMFVGAELETYENEDEDISIQILGYDGSALSRTVKKDDSIVSG